MKQAFLIMTHNNFDVVSSFLRTLDAEDHDFYIHINKKVKTFPKAQLESSVVKGHLYFVDRVAVGYYNYTMVEAVKSLFKTAITNNYDYYHLVSGADMPLKSNEQLDCFLSENYGKNFVGFSNTYAREYVEYNNYFNTLRRMKSKKISKLFKIIGNLSYKVQKLLKINMLKHCPLEVKKGCDWYSITHDAAVYLMQTEPIYKKYFYHSFCPTEYFAQTVLYNSEFKNSFYNTDKEFDGVMRLIDWNRGRPYTFKSTDFEELTISKYLFARKFVETVDFDIVKKLEDYLKA